MSATSPLTPSRPSWICVGARAQFYDAGFVESHVAVRRERDDQQHDLMALERLDRCGPGIQQLREHAHRSGLTALLQ
jgi:hypothetical protein